MITSQECFSDIERYVTDARKSLEKYQWTDGRPAFMVFGSPTDDLLILNAAQTSALIAIAQYLRQILMVLDEPPGRAEAAGVLLHPVGVKA